MADLPVNDTNNVTVASENGDNKMVVNVDGSINDRPSIINTVLQEEGFVASELVTFSGTGFENKMLIQNPALSGVNVIILKISVSLRLAATTNQLNEVRAKVLKNPVVTSVGTSIATRNLHTNGSNTTNTTFSEDPTLSDNGDNLGEVISINAPIDILTPYVISPGDDINLRLRVNDPNNDVMITVLFVEVDV